MGDKRQEAAHIRALYRAATLVGPLAATVNAVFKLGAGGRQLHSNQRQAAL